MESKMGSPVGMAESSVTLWFWNKLFVISAVPLAFCWGFFLCLCCSLSQSATSVSSGSSVCSLTSASSQSSIGYGLTDIFCDALQQLVRIPDLTILHQRVGRLLKYRALDDVPIGDDIADSTRCTVNDAGVLHNKADIQSTALPTYEQHLEHQRESCFAGLLSMASWPMASWLNTCHICVACVKPAEQLMLSFMFNGKKTSYPLYR